MHRPEEAMPRAILFALIVFAGLPAAAQQTAKPVSECALLPTSRENPVIRNKCSQPIHVELFDVQQNALVQGDLAPNQAMQAPLEAFGAICPAGYRSSVALMLVNRPIFAKTMYGCIRK
jgi:hypothetical protein